MDGKTWRFFIRAGARRGIHPKRQQYRCGYALTVAAFYLAGALTFSSLAAAFVFSHFWLAGALLVAGPFNLSDHDIKLTDGVLTFICSLWVASCYAVIFRKSYGAAVRKFCSPVSEADLRIAANCAAERFRIVHEGITVAYIRFSAGGFHGEYTHAGVEWNKRLTDSPADPADRKICFHAEKFLEEAEKFAGTEEDPRRGGAKERLEALLNRKIELPGGAKIRIERE